MVTKRRPRETFSWGATSHEATLAPRCRPMHAAPRVPGLPLVGNLFEMRRDLIAFLVGVAKRDGDAAWAKQGIFNLLVVSGPDVMHEVLVEKADAFVKSYALSVFARPMLGDGLLTSEHEAHKEQRRRLAPAFAHRRVAAYADVMATFAEKAAARMLITKELDVADEMMRMTLDIVAKALFDANLEGDAEAIAEALTLAMRHMIRTLMSVVPIPPRVPTPRNIMGLRLVAKLDEVVYRIIEARRRDPVDRGDVLSILLAPFEDGGAMSDREIRDHVMTLLLAGHETTANALSWSLAELARAPSVRSQMEAEVSLLGGRTPTFDDLKALPSCLAVLKESMRLHPPAFVMGRIAERSVTVGGHAVKKGQIVLLNVVGMHRREDLFERADAFEPERFSAAREAALRRHAYLPFGAGPRVCIGNQFALLEGQIALAVFASRLRLELTEPFPSNEPLITLRPKGGLPMRATPRVTPS